MARKKTRKQKVRSAKRRQAAAGKNDEPVSGVVYKLDDKVLKKSPGKKRATRVRRTSNTNLFDYDPKLLTSDIRKTVILSLLVLGAEVGLYFYLS